MKTHLMLAVIMSVSAAAAESPSLPKFDQKFELPLLSLLDSSKVRSPSFAGEGNNVAAWFHRQVGPRRYISRMPVVTPNPDVDKNMPVKTADPTIDPKILKEPAVDSVK